MRKRLSAWVSRRKSKITSQETSADSADDAASMIQRNIIPFFEFPPRHGGHQKVVDQCRTGKRDFQPRINRTDFQNKTTNTPQNKIGAHVHDRGNGRPKQSRKTVDQDTINPFIGSWQLGVDFCIISFVQVHGNRFRTPATSPSPEGDDHRSTSVRMSTKSSSGPNSRGAMMASSSTRRGISSAAEHDDFSVNSIPPRPETRSPNGQDRSLGHKIPTSLDTAARPSTTPSPTRHQRSSSSGSLSEATHTIAAQGHSGTQSPFWVKVEPHPELICGRQRWYPEETKCVTELVSKVMFTKTMDTFYCTVPKVRRVDRPTHSSYTPELGLGATTASRKNSSISTKEQKEKREWLQWCYLYKKDVEDMFLQRPSLANEQRVDKLCELLAEHMTRCLDDAFRGVSKAEDLNVKVLKDTTIKDSDIFKSKNSTIEVPLNETKPIVKTIDECTFALELLLLSLNVHNNAEFTHPPFLSVHGRQNITSVSSGSI
ncbi:hypothetical protein BCR39DRAFT_502763 [Naematelia encephala]|uniref:Uncharacterized protein n=1 Tax=Naematelia encephala TaxID=71784 RepID=A0A1Y2BL24_9TREE|nr:hypothetical protein BCR39DRAFT_502763 [Naematelia encephala]